VIRGQLDSGVFQKLLQALHLTPAFPDESHARAGKVAQVAHRFRGHEGSAHQAVRTELGEPWGVGDVGFAPGQVLHVPRVDQQHVQGVFQQVVERLPVVAGRLDHHHGDLGGQQELAQREDLVGRRAPRGDLAGERPAPLARRPHAHLRILLAHIQRRTALVHDVHEDLPDHLTLDQDARPGKGREKTGI